MNQRHTPENASEQDQTGQIEWNIEQNLEPMIEPSAEQSVEQSVEQSAEQLFTGSSEMARLMRLHDWSQTSLGAVSTWPQSLRSALSICLHSRFPIAIYWGQEFLLLYNDAWRPIVGDKHPWALGRPAQQAWSEIWDSIGPELAGVLASGEGTFHNDEMLAMKRFGYTEECFFEYTFNPIQGQAGIIDGVFNVVTETTYRVLNDRRARLLREVASRTATARTAEAACELMIETCKSDPADLPFALLYLVDAEGKQARLCGSTESMAESMAESILDSRISPMQIDLAAVDQANSTADPADAWSIALTVQTAQSQVITDLPDRFGRLPGSPWSEPPQEAMVLPIIATGGKVTGVLVAVASPRRRLDDAYQDFFRQIAGQVAVAIANARSYEVERQRAEALAELDRAKTTFFSNVSHEFRTPLTLMLSPLEELSQTLKLQPEQREQLQLIQRNGLRLQKLVNTLLDFSRIEAGRVQAAYQPTDLAGYTAELASVFRSLIERAGLSLQIDCPDLPQPVYIDREMWEKIVLNLLSNAFKFTFSGSITVRLQTVQLQAVGDFVELSVIDTGVGIPEAELPKLFERFHRVENLQGRSFEGSGIGLSLVQELVKLHSGTIRVSSQVDRGTTFTITIPFGTAHLPPDQIRATPTLESTALKAETFVEEAWRWLPEESAGGKDWRGEEEEVEEWISREAEEFIPLSEQAKPFWNTAGYTSPRPSTSSPRILLVDDNADMRDYVKRLLSSRFAVITATNGINALAAVQAHPPDLVLTDVMMPEVNGFELLQALRSDPATQDIPVILLSARAGEEARIEGLAAGADDYLTKPFSARELLARVEATLKLAQLRQEALQREQALRLASEMAQTQAEATSRRIEQLLESMSDAFIALDQDWQIIYQNAAAERINQKPRSEVLGKTLWEEWPAAVNSIAEQQYRYAKTHQAAVHFEQHYHEPPDHDVWLEIDAYPFEEGLGIFYRDVSDRKRAEAEIQQLNQQLKHRVNELQTLFELLPIGVAIATDPTCRLIRVNPYMSKLIRLPVDANASQSAPPDERPLYRLYQDGEEILPADLPMQYAAAHNIDVKDQVIDLTHPDGTLVKLLCCAAPLIDQQGEVRGAIGGFVDITERVQIETALREGEEQIRLATTAAALGMWFWQVQTGELIWTEQCKALFGLPAEAEVSYEAALDLIHPDDRQLANDAVNRALQDRTDYDVEYRAVWADGTVHWIAAKGRCFYDEQNNPIRMMGTVQEITERKRAEAEREQLLVREQSAREAAETANRIKDEFLAVLSHELRTPLNPILGWAKLLQQGRLNAAKTQLALDTIERNAQLQAQLIDDLLDISRILRGKLSLNQSLVDLRDVILAALETVRLAAEAKGIELQFSSPTAPQPLTSGELPNQLPPNSPFWATAELPQSSATQPSATRPSATPHSSSPAFQVLGDAGRLQQVVWNLLSNAVKFTPAAGQIRVMLSPTDSHAQITVSDTGKGIHPDFLPYVFEHFRQEDGATTRKFGGLGLGLAIARQIVEMHGGQIHAASLGEGQGATFTVQLPLAPVIDPILASAPAVVSVNNLNNIRILAVDDEADSCQLVAFALEQAGAVVTSATSGVEALQMLKQSQFDLIISDIGMPEMDGYMLMRQIRETDDQVPAIALTAYAGELDREQALKAGFQQHLAKPVEPTELVSIAVRLCGGTPG